MSGKKKGPVVKRKTQCVRKGVCAPVWLSECAGDMPRAMLCGRGYLAVENCGRVLAFDEGKVVFGTAQGTMAILGSGLCLSRESGHTAVISGRVDSIRLEDV